MTRAIRGGISAPMLVLALAACATRADLPEHQPLPLDTTLEVVNRAHFDMTIFVLREGGPRERLGLAPAVHTTHFAIPARLMFGPTSLRFQADPVGAPEAVLSRDILVSPGDTVVMEIPPTWR